MYRAGTDRSASEEAVNSIRKYQPSIVAIDGNLAPEATQLVVKHCYENDIKGVSHFHEAPVSYR